VGLNKTHFIVTIYEAKHKIHYENVIELARHKTQHNVFHAYTGTIITGKATHSGKVLYN